MTRFGEALCLLLFIVSVATSVFAQTKSSAAAKGTSARTSAAETTASTETAASAGVEGGKANAKVGTSGSATSGEPASGTTAPAGSSATTGAPAPVTSTPTSQQSTQGSMDGSTYQVRLRDLEQKVDELKEQIRRSHTRLSLLSETILSGGTGGARAEITFINDMSSAFRMTQALFVLDGAVQYNKQDETGVLAGQKEIPIFSGSIPPGDHTLQVLVKLRGHGYGVFSYLQGYRFEIRSSHSFTITEGKTIELKAIAFEKGDVTTPIEQRPAVRYHKNVKAGVQPVAAAQTSENKPSLTGTHS